jgi:hypothetical protein
MRGTEMMHALLSRGVISAVAGIAALIWTNAAVAQPAAPEPPPPAEPWYEAIELKAFVDAYANVNWAFPKPQNSSGANPVTRAYDTTNGFALSWVGVDASYAPDPVGGTINLRLGPTATIYAQDDANHGLENVKQAFISWKPGGGESAVTIDFGKFDQPHGAEVPDSQYNMNYTRGVLYWLAQPLFHTGFRFGFELMDELTLKAFVVNGWNRSVDNNIGKTYGLQALITPSKALAVSASWMGGPEQDDVVTIECDPDFAYDPTVGACASSPGAPGGPELVDRGGANDFDAWRHLLDLVITVTPVETLSLIANADYGWEGVREGTNDEPTTKKWYGAMLGARLQLDPVWAVAGRGEYYMAPDGHMPTLTAPGGETIEDLAIATGTLTIEAKPTDNLILRLEGRGDFVVDGSPTQEIFQESVRDRSDMLLTTTLGVVVTTN